MTGHRFFLGPDSFAGDSVVFPDDVSHQIRRVLRLHNTDTVIALDGTGMEYVVRLNVGSRDVCGTIEERRPNRAEPSVFLTLYMGMVKGHKFELVVQKCTEVGVSRFVPVITARSVAQEPSASRQRRFEAIVREAAEQSGRGILPVVEEARPYQEVVAEAGAIGPAFLLWEGEREGRVERVETRPRAAGLFVGPEGGFTEAEVRAAAAAGAAVLSLGPRILRAETAAIVGTAMLLARLEDV